MYFGGEWLKGIVRKLKNGLRSATTTTKKEACCVDNIFMFLKFLIFLSSHSRAMLYLIEFWRLPKKVLCNNMCTEFMLSWWNTFSLFTYFFTVQYIKKYSPLRAWFSSIIFPSQHVFLIYVSIWSTFGMCNPKVYFQLHYTNVIVLASTSHCICLMLVWVT